MRKKNTEPVLVSPNQLTSLRSALGGGDKPLLIVIHDYPDPDAIASAMAYQTLAASWGIPSVIAHGGGIGRPENRKMVESMAIERVLFQDVKDFGIYRGALFSDTQPPAKNHSLPPEVTVLAVVDHHALGQDSVRVLPAEAAHYARAAFIDIRSDVGSSSTLAHGYLEAAGIVPDKRLATALFLGIRTDTDNLLRDVSPADVAAYVRLLPLSDLALVAGITRPPLSRSHFQFLAAAMAKARIRGGTLVAPCGDIPAPDMISTVSDFLVQGQGIQYALGYGFHGNRIYLSLRAKPPRNDATRVLLAVVGEEGRGGGHNLAAGGFLEPGGDSGACTERMLRRFLDITGAAGAEETALI